MKNLKNVRMAVAAFSLVCAGGPNNANARIDRIYAPEGGGIPFEVTRPTRLIGQCLDVEGGGQGIARTSTGDTDPNGEYIFEHTCTVQLVSEGELASANLLQKTRMPDFAGRYDSYHPGGARILVLTGTPGNFGRGHHNLSRRGQATISVHCFGNLTSGCNASFLKNNFELLVPSVLDGRIDFKSYESSSGPEETCLTIPGGCVNGGA